MRFEYKGGTARDLMAAAEAERPRIEADGYAFQLAEWRRGLRGRQLIVHHNPVERPGTTEPRPTTDLSPVLAREYGNDSQGRQDLAGEAQQLSRLGYAAVAQSEDPGHLHAGRLLLTGGLSILAGKSGTRSDGRLTVTYRLIAPHAPTAGRATEATLAERLKQLDDARAAGPLTDEEHDRKRAEILADF